MKILILAKTSLTVFSTNTDWKGKSDAELTCMCFFSGVLMYCVMLQAFVCYRSYVICL